MAAMKEREMIDLEKLRDQAEDDLKRGREWSTTSRDVLMLLDHIAQLEKKLKNKEAVLDVFGAALRGESVDGIAHPTQQGLEQFIEKAGDVHFQRCRVGSAKGALRWDIEFGHYGAEVSGKTLQEAIAKARAAQAKQKD